MGYFEWLNDIKPKKKYLIKASWDVIQLQEIIFAKDEEKALNKFREIRLLYTKILSIEEIK